MYYHRSGPFLVEPEVRLPVVPARLPYLGPGGQMEQMEQKEQKEHME